MVTAAGEKKKNEMKINNQLTRSSTETSQSSALLLGKFLLLAVNSSPIPPK